MPFFFTTRAGFRRPCAVTVSLVRDAVDTCRPKEAMERVVGGIDQNEQMPSHPSLAFHDLIKKLGNIIPQSPKDVTVMQRRVDPRGHQERKRAQDSVWLKEAALGIALPLLTAVAVGSSTFDIRATRLRARCWRPPPWSILRAQRICAAALALLAGRNRSAADYPMRSIFSWFASMSGLGLDQAILQVSKELEHAHPEITEEFGMVNLELKAGKRRVEALRNLAERTGVDDLKKLVAVLIQADRFGTGVAQSLRAHADFMRIQARQVAEEKAAKLGVKLIFPIFFCILPSLFVVTVGPVAMKIIRELIPMMNNI